jgi:hypothetical protein
MKVIKNIGAENVRAKILVCYYQPWQLPKDNIFLPIQAGKSVSGFNLGIQGDDTMDNISIKNASFSEFTAWYWGWKNIKKLYPSIEYVGLSHYRRFFALDEPFEKHMEIHEDQIPEMENYENIIIKKLENKDIILVKPAIFGCDLITQYSKWHYISDYYCIKDIVHEIYPEYDESFSNFFESNNTMSLYCIFVARYELFNDYFEWLFPLLFEAEKRIDVSGYNSEQKRVLAFLAERLLNIYVYHNKLKVQYEPIYFIDGARNIKNNFKALVEKIIRFFVPYGIMVWHRKQIKKHINRKGDTLIKN